MAGVRHPGDATVTPLAPLEELEPGQGAPEGPTGVLHGGAQLR